MSTEKSTALALRSDVTVGVYEPASLDQATQMCERLVKSGFLGPHVKDANQALAIAMTGHELGFPFMASFRKIYVFQGRVGVMTQLLVAKVKASPLCEYFRTVESTDTSCTVETKRRGSPAPESYTFTIADAQRAGYVEKNPKYKAEPRRMLYARAAGYLCNDVYSDLTLGMEPAELISDVEPERDVTPPRSVATGGEVRPLSSVPPAAPVDAELVEKKDWPAVFRGAADEDALATTLAAYQKVKEKLTTAERKDAQAAFKARKGELEAAARAAEQKEPEHDPATGEVVPPAGEPVREPGAEG